MRPITMKARAATSFFTVATNVPGCILNRRPIEHHQIRLSNQNRALIYFRYRKKLILCDEDLQEWSLISRNFVQ